MKFAQHDRAQQRKSGKTPRRASRTLAGHRAFAPMLGLWGAMLGGLTVMVLPATLVAVAFDATGWATAGLPVQAIAAVFAALLLGGGLYILAKGLHRRARRAINTPSLAEWAIRSLGPLDPIRDLGSRSLDDPLDAMPFVASAERDAEYAETAQVPDAAPRELDLAAFAVLPGRNAVWVQGEPETPRVADVDQTSSDKRDADTTIESTPVTSLRKSAQLPDPGTAALARLRAVAPSELSIVEMVERFAGALHEHRTSPPSKAVSAADLAAREAALAEALKALAALSAESLGDDAREPLRSALAGLQPRRGAA